MVLYASLKDPDSLILCMQLVEFLEMSVVFHLFQIGMVVGFSVLLPHKMFECCNLDCYIV